MSAKACVGDRLNHLVRVRPRRCPYAGFTLIELLVVIAIVAILIGILLPVLGSARDAGHNAQCLANLKNIFIASMAYVNDYDGFLPSRDAVEPGIPDSWDVSPVRLRPGDFLPAIDPIAPGAGPEEWGLAALYERGQYMQVSPDSWVCQANVPFLDYKMSYSYAISSAREKVRYEELRKNRTSTVIFVFDAFSMLPALPSSIGPAAYTVRPGIPDALQQPVHARGGAVSVLRSTNAVFLDGHVAQRLD